MFTDYPGPYLVFMHDLAAQIQCTNFVCQTLNSPEREVCCHCHLPLLKRYLRVIGEGVEDYRIGELVDNRYLFRQPRVVLDTKPGIIPHVAAEIPGDLLPYFRLFLYRLHVPQVYGLLDRAKPYWLLEYGTAPRSDPTLMMPRLEQIWQQATALRQLNWLWQIAGLWQPLLEQGVASSLLASSLLQANGSVVQLLELQTDSEPPELKQLGRFWSQWLEGAAPSIARFLGQLCLHLEQGQIQRSEQLLDSLERGMQQCSASQQRSYQIFTYTDCGPRREHNEDACYPPINRLVRTEEGKHTLAIVCDGLGGQEGGEVASQLAVETLQEEIASLSLDSKSPNLIDNCQSLERAVSVVNDLISARNDREERHERQRMGTTLVMTLAHAHSLYLVHVGDSRIYWITADGCCQVTVDDDLASREARLGYAFYRDIVHYPQAGSLVQALGMDSSSIVHPTVQRLILDEDSVFLLCSDGLSDFERVEQYWRSEILPILEHKVDIVTAAKRLVEIANQQNGHDNVTVALVYCQVQPAQEPLPKVQFILSASSQEAEARALTTLPQPQKQQLQRPAWTVGLLLVVISILIAIFFNDLKDLVDKLKQRQSNEAEVTKTVLCLKL